MKNVDVSINISNSDVSTMLVEGYLERRRRTLADLQVRFDSCLIALDECLDSIDDLLAKKARPVVEAIQASLDLLSVHYTGPYAVATTWRQLPQGFKSEKLRRRTDLHPSYREDSSYTPEFLTRCWITAGLGIFYPNRPHFSEVSPSSSFTDHPDAPFVLSLPVPIFGTSFATQYIDAYPFGRPQSPTLVSFKGSKKLSALVSQAGVLSAELQSLKDEISVINHDIKDSAAIARKVTARLTQATLAEAGDLSFIKNILDGIQSPLFIGLDHG